MLKDALGNPIVFGERYGHARYQNGFNRVTTGTALHLTKSGLLSICPDKVMTGLYKDLNTEETEIPKTISVKSVLVFPIK